jgi:hypothetical protein
LNLESRKAGSPEKDAALVGIPSLARTSTSVTDVRTQDEAGTLPRRSSLQAIGERRLQVSLLTLVVSFPAFLLSRFTLEPVPQHKSFHRNPDCASILRPPNFNL